MIKFNQKSRSTMQSHNAKYTLTIDEIAITKNRLDDLLQIEDGTDNSPFHTTQSARGDGQLDPYLSIFSNHSEPWITREYGSITPPKKQIIFSNGHYKLRPKQPVEENIMAAMIKHYDVIVFKKGIRIQHAKRATSITDLNQVDGASKADIECSLASQGEACENYYIIDLYKYAEILMLAEDFCDANDTIECIKNQAPDGGKSTVDLDYVSTDEYEELLKTCNLDKISEVIISTPNFQDLAFIKKNFSPSTLRIKDVNQSWINKYWAYLTSYSIILDNFLGTKAFIPDGGQKFLQFDRCKKLSEVEAENPSMCLSIYECPNLVTNSLHAAAPTHSYKQISEVFKAPDSHAEPINSVIVDEPVDSNTDWSPYPQITHFAVDGAALDFLSLANLPFERMESLTLVGKSTVGYSHAHEYPVLSYLRLKDCKAPYHLDASKFPSLRTLILDHVKHANDSTRTLIISIPTLTRLEVMGDYDQIVIHGCENLEVVIIKSVFKKNKGPFSPELSIEYESLRNMILLDTYTGLSIFHLALRDSPFQLRKLPKLKKLYVAHHTDSMISLSRLISEATQLKHLDIFDNPPTVDYPLQNHHALRFVRYSSIYPIKNLPPQDLLLRYYSSSVPATTEEKEYDRKQKPVPLSQPSTAVMIYDNTSELSVDSETAASDVAYVAKGNLSGALEASYPIANEYIRVSIFDSIIETIDPHTHKLRLLFFAAIAKNMMQPVIISNTRITDYDIKLLRAEKASNPALMMGYIKGSIAPSQVYSILDAGPVQGPSSKPQFLCENAENIELYWHPKHQHYYFYLKPGQPVQEIVLRYLLHTCTINNNKNFNDPVITQLLDRNLKSKIFSRLTHPKNKMDAEKLTELQFLFSDIPLEEKLNKIFLHCKSFSGENLQDPVDLDLDVLLDEIIEKKGACRHRAEACMLLFHFLNCELLLPHNPLHAYNSFPLGSGELHKLDLGGLAMKNATDKARYSEIEKELHELPKAPPASIQEQDPHIESYEEKLQEKITVRKIDNYETLLASSLRHPLVIIDEQIKEYNFIWRLTKCVIEKNKHLTNFLYINKPADLEFYLRPYALLNNRRVAITGPLVRIIKENGVIVINWKNFSPADRGNYKSLLDDLASIKGEFITGDVQVIGLVHAEYLQAAFESRCTKVSLDEKLLEPPKEKITVSAIANSIDLFQRADWREPLLGEIEYINKGARIAKGPFIEAMLNGKPISIVNPPNDPDFHVLVNQIKQEGRVFWNNDYIMATAGFSLTLRDEPRKIIAPNIQVIPGNDLNSNTKKIYLTNNTFHECFRQLVASQDNFPVSISGHLENSDPDINVFYITEPIQLSAWNLLNNFVLQKFPDKKFNFVFAPGAGIVSDSETLHFNETILPSHKPIIFTNDPDFYLLEEKAGKVSFVNEKVSFADLIAEKEIVFQEATGVVNLFIKKKGILTAIASNEDKIEEHVILCGVLTTTVYNKLLPLLSDQPHIDVNGSRIHLSGSLAIVMPLSSQSQFRYANQEEKIYSLDDYRKRIPPQDLANFSLLEKYIALVKTLPKKLGRGRPDEIIFTFDRIIRMLDALRDGKLHPQNPIKGLINYDFPKNTEDYAYLNVIAKITFRPDISKSLRIEKFLSYQETEENIWRLLNCFSGAELKDIFNKSKVKLSFNLGLDDKKALMNVIKRYVTLPQSAVSTEKARAEKQKFEFQLETLLADPKKTLCVIQGPPGVGKTRSLRSLATRYDLIYVEGFKNILRWLAALSNKPIIFGIDEYNLSPEMSNFLKGINLAKQEVFFNGKFYPLSPMHKIFATGNPASFPHRFYHEFFQQQGETIYLTMPKNEVLLQNHISPTMNLQGCAEFSPSILDIYNLIQQFVLHHDYSFRSLLKFMNRFFAAKIVKPQFENLKETLYKAAIEEFSFAIEDPALRAQFVEQVARMLAVYNHSQLVEKNVLTLTATFIDKGQPTQKNIYIPPNKIPLIRAIQHDIDLMERAVANPVTAALYHRGILIEGPIGIGKSTNFQFILQNRGYSLNGKGPKRYYVIHANDPDAPILLLKAFHAGSKVILEELNANRQIEILLNQLLEGCDDQGQAAEVPGFMVFASQNPSTEVALCAVSAAAKDRMHVLYMDPLSDEEVEIIASTAGVAHPQALRQAHKNLTPYGSNARFLMQLIQEEKLEQVPISSHVISTQPNL
jgi:hypothetical protein